MFYWEKRGKLVSLGGNLLNLGEYSLVFPSLLQLLPDQPDTHFQLPLFLIVVHVSEGGLENGQNSFSNVTAAKREGMALQGGIMVANLYAVDRFIFSS